MTIYEKVSLAYEVVDTPKFLQYQLIALVI